MVYKREYNSERRRKLIDALDGFSLKDIAQIRENITPRGDGNILDVPRNIHNILLK